MSGAPAKQETPAPAKGSPAPAKAGAPKAEQPKEAPKASRPGRGMARMFHPTNGREVYTLKTMDGVTATEISITPALLSAMMERAQQLGGSVEVYGQVATEFGFEDAANGADLLLAYATSATPTPATSGSGIACA